MDGTAAIALALALGIATNGLLGAAETPPLSKSGIKTMQLVTAVDAVTPGEILTVGLLIEPEAGFHTYWKGPGIVGVATSIEWVLPEGFIPGPVLWPPPELTDMAGIQANGYSSEKILLTDISVPETLESDDIIFRAKVAWMACSTSCHPGLAEVELSLPVNRSGESGAPENKYAARFESVRKSIPSPAPESWRFHISLPKQDLVELAAEIPDFALKSTEGIHFFSYDHQVDSDKPQKILADESENIVLQLPRPEFAPSHPVALSGVLFNPNGWPAVDSKWVEISVPWPEGTFDDE